MLKNARVGATIPVSNMERARDFYENVLGLDVLMEAEDGSAIYACGDGTIIGLYHRPGHQPAGQTLASWIVEHAETEIDELIERGVTFLQYDIPEMGIKTDEKGLTQVGNEYGGWFTDPDGNILGIFQM